jgi:hypothetical protein
MFRLVSRHCPQFRRPTLNTAPEPQLLLDPLSLYPLPHLATILPHTLYSNRGMVAFPTGVLMHPFSSVILPRLSDTLHCVSCIVSLHSFAYIILLLQFPSRYSFSACISFPIDVYTGVIWFPTPYLTPYTSILFAHHPNSPTSSHPSSVEVQLLSTP